MNRKKRMQNRANAEMLRKQIRSQIGCDRCGMKELHFIATGEITLQDILDAKAAGIEEVKQPGFYTCPDLYDKEDRRKELADDPVELYNPAVDGMLGALVVVRGMLHQHSAPAAYAASEDEELTLSLMAGEDSNLEIRAASIVSPP